VSCKPTSKVQPIRYRRADAERLLYVRRIAAEWVARIAIPRTCEAQARRQTCGGQFSSSERPRGSSKRATAVSQLALAVAARAALFVAGQSRAFGIKTRSKTRSPHTSISFTGIR
jgi:hypothetical protein